MNTQSDQAKIQMPTDIDYHSYRQTVKLIGDTRISGARSIVLDFSQSESAFAGSMLAICCEVISLRESPGDRTSFTLTLPIKVDLRNLFLHSNWAHLIDPETYAESSYKDDRKIPALRFRDPKEQKSVIVKVINSFMKSMCGFSRDDLSSIDWTLSEIIDNVLLHSLSPIGGMIQVMNMNNKNRIEFSICDPGLGVTETLKGTSKGIVTDRDALLHCVRKGVTRDPNIGKGYGLYGSSCIAINSGGYFSIHSGKAYMIYPRDQKTSRRNIQKPKVIDHPTAYFGTLIMASVDLSSPDTLLNALSFNDDNYVIIDAIENRYETIEKIKEYDDIIIRIKDQVDSYGSRIAAFPLRLMIENFLRISDKQQVVLDFTEVPMFSHSFADEAVGKLFISASLQVRLNRLKWINISPLCEKILGLVIQQNKENN